ncbi:MAG: hypothetical protein ACYC96_00755 [Fimbriimonadaceae bacterium]
MNHKLIYVVLGIASFGAASAQVVKVNPGVAGYGKDVFYGGAYDRKTAVSVRAKIRGISRTPGSSPNEAADVALLVSPFSMAPDRYGKQRMIFSAGYLNVELGPDWFVNSQTTKLHVNDYVEIIGSRMSIYGKPAIVAQAVRRRHSVLALRRLNGEPYWYALGNPATTGATAPVSGDAQPAVDVPTPTTPAPVQNPPNRLGTTMIYGNAFPIAGAQNAQSGIMGSGIQPLAPIGGPIIIMGNYWYGRPFFW